MLPQAFTVRLISIGPSVQAGRAGGGPAGRAHVSAQPGEVGGGHPRGQGLQVRPADGQVHGGGVDPQRDGVTGAVGTQPELLATNPEVAAAGHDPVDLHRCQPGRPGLPNQLDRVWFLDRVGLRVERGDAAEFGWSPQRQHRALFERDGVEVVGGWIHVPGLVRPGVVVLSDPPIDGLLSGINAGERAVVVQEFGLDALVPPLDLPGGRWRPDLGQ
jgi:hypothetical protein